MVLVSPDRESTDAQLETIARWLLNSFLGRCWLAVEMQRVLDDEMWLYRMRLVSELTAIPLVASGDVRMHLRSRKMLHDVMTAARRVLKKRFAPTLFVCDVPLENLHPGTVAEFAGTALESIFQELLDGPTYAPDKWRGDGFSIRVPLEPSCILGHFHPVIIRDPLR